MVAEVNATKERVEGRLWDTGFFVCNDGRSFAEKEISVIDDFVQCWTCKTCLYDLNLGFYVCGKHGWRIGGNYEACKPTDCEDWER